jgi:hypothetical protein
MSDNRGFISWLSGFFTSLLSRFLIRKNESSQFLVAPSYDVITQRTSQWASSWQLPGVSSYVGQTAQYQTILVLLRSSRHGLKLLLFVGHGKAAGLLTHPKLGKSDSPIRSNAHGCLVDTDDLIPPVTDVHIVAWACESGIYFGHRVASLKNSGFLGFSESISLVFNHEQSEILWGSAMEALFVRMSNKGSVEPEDGEWLRNMLLSLREKLKKGEITTGRYNRVNAIFLKAAARSACAHISKG